MKHNLILYIAVCLLFFITLTNITLFDGEWNGIAMWLSTGVFIFATATFGFSKNTGK